MNSNRIKPLIIWGGTGQALVIEEFAAALYFTIAVIVDNNPGAQSPIEGVDIVYKSAGLQSFIKNESPSKYNFAVAIGGDKGKDRSDIGRALEKTGFRPVTLLHPKSYVSKTATVGKGSQVLINSTISAKASVADYCIINNGALVDHECQLGIGVHVGPGAILTGLVTVGDFSFIGAGAIILPRVRIGNNSIVGAGSVVTKDIPDNTIVMGNPARFHSKNKAL